MSRRLPLVGNIRVIYKITQMVREPLVEDTHDERAGALDGEAYSRLGGAADGRVR